MGKNFYRVNVYNMKKDKHVGFIGTSIVEKNFFGKIIDTASAYEYAPVSADRDGHLLGLRENVLDQAGEDLIIFKQDLNDNHIATAEQVIDYQDTFPVTTISEKQNTILRAMELSDTIGKTR